MPWLTAFRSRWVSGSARLSRIARSSSVSPPVTVNSTCLPAAWAMSRIARGSGPVIAETGRVRIRIAESVSSPSNCCAAPSWRSTSSGRPAAAPTECSRRRWFSTTSPTRSSIRSIFPGRHPDHRAGPGRGGPGRGGPAAAAPAAAAPAAAAPAAAADRGTAADRGAEADCGAAADRSAEADCGAAADRGAEADCGAAGWTAGAEG